MECSGKKTNRSDDVVENGGACEFCLRTVNDPDRYGKTLIQNGITVHYFCMLFSSGLCQRGKSEKQGILGFLPEDILKEKRRGARLRCSYCRKNGATIGCVVKNCRRAFHLICGKENGTLHQYFDTYRSYCLDHRPRQALPVSDRLAFPGTANTVCAICLNSVEAWTFDHTLRSPCCRNSWFHRNCVQRFATSAGLYFFKCPLCNNKDRFQEEMLNFGIYIPDQDAAWETEPNAFVELLERYMYCDAQLCRCSHGRNYNKDSSKWKIIICDWCGSKGTHVHCRGLVKIGNEDVCSECKNIGDKVSKEKKRLSTPRSRKLVSFERNFDQKNKSEYPGPSGRLHKTSLPVVESVRISLVTDAETDVEVDVCAEQSGSSPLHKKIKRKRYRGSPNKLYPCIKRCKLSTSHTEDDPNVYEYESSNITLSSSADINANYQDSTIETLRSKRKSKPRRRSFKGSLDVVHEQRRRNAVLKQKGKLKSTDKNAFALDSAQKTVEYRRISATVTSPRDLDGGSDDTCNSSLINSPSMPSVNHSSTSSAKLILCVDNTDTSRNPPTLSPPILVNATNICKSRNRKTEDIPPLLFPEISLGSVRSEVCKPDAYFNCKRQSPRLVAQKKFERRKSAIDRMSICQNQVKRKRRKSLQYVRNQPSIMHWFHSDRTVTDVLDQQPVLKCNDQSDICRHGDLKPSQSSLEMGKKNNTSKNERKTLVIKWRNKQIVVKPTGKEMMTISGKVLASSELSKPPKPICTVAPSPRSRPIHSPRLLSIEKGSDAISLPPSTSSSNGHDVAEWKVNNIDHILHDPKSLKTTPSTSMSWFHKSSKMPVSTFEQMKDETASSSRTPHSAAVIHFTAVDDLLPSESCKAKYCLSRKFKKVDGTDLTGTEPKADDMDIGFNGSGERFVLSRRLKSDSISHNPINDLEQLATSMLSHRVDSLTENDEIIISSDESDIISVTETYDDCTINCWMEPENNSIVEHADS